MLDLPGDFYIGSEFFTLNSKEWPTLGMKEVTLV